MTWLKCFQNFENLCGIRDESKHVDSVSIFPILYIQVVSGQKMQNTSTSLIKSSLTYLGVSFQYLGASRFLCFERNCAKTLELSWATIPPSADRTESTVSLQYSLYQCYS